jgi:hypothetical protein
MSAKKVEPKRLPRETYQKLEAIVGPDWISEDRAVIECYSKGGHGPTDILPKHMKNPGVIPACVILPESTEEVQAIVRICNRYEVPLFPATNIQSASMATLPGSVCIHFSRMDKVLEINEEDMTAVVQPYASYDKLQSEAMKKGLWNGGCIIAGGTCKIASQFNTYAGMWQSDLKYGGINRNVVSVKEVLSDGELLITGSAGQPATEDFCEFSPGPDLIGLARGSLGTFGLVTEITVKLHTWVGGFPFPEDLGHRSIDTYFEDVEQKSFERVRPPERHKIQWIEFPDLASELEALYKISTSGIGIGLNGGVVSYALYFSAQTDDLTNKRAEEGFIPPWNCYVTIAGITSERQLEYEEKVLKQIATETKGKLISEDYKPELFDALAIFNQECVRNVTGMRICRGGWGATFLPMGSFTLAEAHAEIWGNALETLGEFHITDRAGAGNFSSPTIYAINRGHFCSAETDNYPRTHADVEILVKNSDYKPYVFAGHVKKKTGPGCVMGVVTEPFLSLYPEIGPNAFMFFRKIRKALDPKGIFAPGKRVYTEEEFKKMPAHASDVVNKFKETFGLERVKPE